MNREIVNKRIQLLTKYLDRLEGFQSVNFDQYLNNFDLQLIAERLIELLVEAASDINSYLLVQIYQQPPETYFDSFIEMGNRGIINRELSTKLAQSAGMRNRLVHQYDEINHQLVFEAIPIALEQYPLYIRQIISFLNSLEEENA